MARTDNLTNYLTDIASAIKEKKGDEVPIKASEFDEEIRNLPSSEAVKFKPKFISFSKCPIETAVTTEDISKIDTSEITNMRSMFAEAYIDDNGIDFSTFDTSKVTSMQEMFYFMTGSSRNNVLDVSTFDTRSVENMSNMFGYVNSVDTINVKGFNTQKVTNMSGLFGGCNNLRNIDLSTFNTSNVDDMSFMFYLCFNIEKLDISMFDFSKVTNMQYFCSNCYGLTSLDFGGKSAPSLNNTYGMLESLNGLTDLIFLTDVGQGFSPDMEENYEYYKINLSFSNELTHDSLMTVINGVADIKTLGINPQMIQLGETNLSKLSDEEKQIAINKGWNLS